MVVDTNSNFLSLFHSVCYRWSTCWIICLIGLMLFVIGCGDSPAKDSNSDNEVRRPSLENMVLIPAGEFLLGSLEGEGAYDEHPQHEVYLDAFYIDKYEVTNAQFQEFVNATGYVTDAERKGYGEVYNPEESEMRFHIFTDVNWRRPNAWRTTDNRPHPKAWENYQLADKMDYPVVQVSWNDAQAYATWVRKRLPTEAEWEKAARGTDGRKWAWGNEFNLNIGGINVHANINSGGLLSVGCFPTGVSPYGVYNMIGNAREWVADFYAPDYYIHSHKDNPLGPEIGTFHVIRGGSWAQIKSYHVLIANRAYQVPNYSSNFVGFRCAWSEYSLK